MKSNEFDQLLSGLLGDKNADPKPQNDSTSGKTSAASEESRRRVEEIMRNVERESDKRKSEEQSRPKVQPLPKREPVVVPPPISHFSEEPSQNPAVRMRDRLDETALPMLDSERKPTQVIPPKPKPESAPKKKKKRPAPQPSVDIPAPPTPPKRSVPHIVVPDELPPDIPRETAVSAADEERRKKLEAIRRAVKEQRNVKLETAAEMAEASTEIAEPTRIMTAAAEEPAVMISEPEAVEENVAEVVPEITESAEDPTESVMNESEADSLKNERDKEILSKAQIIKQQIRQAMEAIQSLPETDAAEESDLSEQAEETEDTPVSEEMQEETAENAAYEEAAENDSIEEASEISETPVTASETTAAPRLRHLSVPVEPEKKQGLFAKFRKNKQEKMQEQPADEPEQNAENSAETSEELETYTEPEAYIEPEISEDFAAAEESEVYTEPDISEDFTAAEKSEVYTEPEESEEPETVAETETQESVANKTESIDVNLPDEEARARKRSAFSAAIRAALDENAQELEEVRAEQLPTDDEIDVAVGKSRKGKRGYLVAGFICTIFAIIGVVFCVMQGIRWIRDFVDSSSLKRQLEDVLYPVVVMDLPEYEDASEAAPEMLMSAAVMDILMYDDLSKYTEVFDVISIPAEDVKNRAEAMFGVTLSDEYMTLFAAGELFFYDESSGSYNVPSSPVIFSYAPEVQNISRVEDMYTVTVIYRADTAQWQHRSENFTSAGEKTMEITLVKIEDDYQIVRIKNVSAHSSGI